MHQTLEHKPSGEKPEIGKTAMIAKNQRLVASARGPGRRATTPIACFAIAKVNGMTFRSR
jgi:hypothetical protein